MKSDNYYGSPYNHWDYILFKDCKPYKMDGKKRGFLSSLNGTRYFQVSNTLLLYKLVDYYKDLNNVLQRILDNYHDDMFMRYAFRAKVFGNEQRFIEFLQIWDDIFSHALQMYVTKYHNLFDESYGISYVMYFNMKFSACLFFQTIEVLKKFNNRAGYPEGFRYCRDVETYHYSLNCASKEAWTHPVHLADDYYQELLYQSFSPLTKSIV